MARKILISQTITILACSIAAFLIGGSVSILRLSAENAPAGTSVNAIGFTFTKDLKFGDESSDVYWLQVALNRDPATQIAKVGVGSPGKESKYYGNLTKKAVVRFKAKYFKDGDLTGTNITAEIRKKLNEIIAPTLGTIIPAKNSVNSENAGLDSGVSGFLDKVKGDLSVYKVTPYQVKPGETITITGQGFDAYNTVYFGTIKLANVPAQDGQTIVIASSTTVIPVGDYSVVVQNSRGSSKGPNSTDIRVKVTDSPLSVPEVYSVSPMRVSVNDTITITGKNFSANGNIVVSPHGKVEGVSSYDGMHMTVPVAQLVSRLLNATAGKKWSPGTPIKMSLQVVNDRGVTPIAVTIELVL